VTNFARLRIGALLMCLALAALIGATPVEAQTTEAAPVEPSPVQADLKGVIGLGLIGAELGFFIPAALGAEPWWMYLVFPVVGAAGGGVAGYFALEQGAGHPEVAVAMLVTGIALVIPTLVYTVSRTSYNGEEDMPTTPSTARARKAQASARRATEAGPGLVRLAQGELLVRPPAVSVGRNVSVQEARRTGADAHRQYSVALLSGRF
jgi:hypothetical protein